MIAAVLRMERAPSEAKCRRIAEMLDQDKDGAVDLNDIDKVRASHPGIGTRTEPWISMILIR